MQRLRAMSVINTRRSALASSEVWRGGAEQDIIAASCNDNYEPSGPCKNRQFLYVNMELVS
jgi:hypothetical protein